MPAKNIAVDVVKALVLGELNDDFGQKRSLNAGGEGEKRTLAFHKKKRSQRDTQSEAEKKAIVFNSCLLTRCHVCLLGLFLSR